MKRASTWPIGVAATIWLLVSWIPMELARGHVSDIGLAGIWFATLVIGFCLIWYGARIIAPGYMARLTAQGRSDALNRHKREIDEAYEDIKAERKRLK